MKSKSAILKELESCKKSKEEYEKVNDNYMATIYNHIIYTLNWVLSNE